MAAKKLNVAKVKGTTSSGMQFEMSGNVAGVCQELFNYIENAAMRSRVIDAIQQQHIALTEHNPETRPEATTYTMAVASAAQLLPEQGTEYMRGMCETLATLFPIDHITTEDRAQEVEKDLLREVGKS